MTEIRGKVALVTGGANGIGRLLADAFAADGARLILWDIDEQALLRAKDELSARGHSVDTQVVDLTSPEQIAAAAREALSVHGKVDILINNAGIVSGKPLLELSAAEIERTFQVNAIALFHTVRAFLPAMLEDDSGHIVTIASAAGLAGTAKLTDYCSSKFAAVGFDESLRFELKQQGSKVVTTVVCPFYVATDMFAGVNTRFAWLLPIIAPEDLVRRIVRAVHRNRRRLLMPWFAYTVWPSRLLPVAWFDALMGFLGVSRSMETFKGHGDRAADG
ncbi:MAG TPA: SDR family oxidoreductase [Woeseiaceae bacterium]